LCTPKKGGSHKKGALPIKLVRSPNTRSHFIETSSPRLDTFGTFSGLLREKSRPPFRMSGDILPPLVNMG